MKSIRNEYEDQGVRKFYQENGRTYKNPHEAFIQDLIKNNDHRIDYSKVLDFCCGSGEVSLALKEMGYTKFSATDPYTQKAYLKRVGKSCLPYTFHDIIKGALKTDFTAIICSFAMHLCPEEQLYPLAHGLLRQSPLLVILTPHKRPQLELIDGIELDFEDHVLTERGKKIRLKAYQKSY